MKNSNQSDGIYICWPTDQFFHFKRLLLCGKYDFTPPPRQNWYLSKSSGKTPDLLICGPSLKKTISTSSERKKYFFKIFFIHKEGKTEKKNQKKNFFSKKNFRKKNEICLFLGQKQGRQSREPSRPIEDPLEPGGAGFEKVSGSLPAILPFL